MAEIVAIPASDAEPIHHGAVRIYFDSTEVRAPSASTTKLGRIADPKLHVALRKAGFQSCVPDLVIEEIAYRRLRYLRKEHGKLLKLAIRDHVSATRGKVRRCVNEEQAV